MITEKQKLANTQNAKLGGVKTATGKSVSKYNAVKHGVLNVILSDYENDMSKNIYQQLVIDLKPEGFLEVGLVERIAVGFIRLFRVGKAEGEFMKSTLDPVNIRRINSLANDGLEYLSHEFETVEITGYRPEITKEAIQDLDHILLRYETSIENKIYKAIHELQRLQAMRLGRNIPLPSVVDVNSDSTQ